MKQISAMKKFILTTVLASAMIVGAQAQETKSKADTVVKDIGRGAKKAGNKTAELGVKGGAALLDQKIKDKVGPAGQTVYRDGKDRIFYIDDKGAKMYLKKSQLKPKVDY